MADGSRRKLGCGPAALCLCGQTNSRLGKPPPLAVRLEEAMPSRRAVLKCLQRLRGYVTGRGALWSYRGSAPLFRWLTT